MSNRQRRFVRGSVLSFGALIMSFGFALLTSVLIARSLGTDGKGAYSVALRSAGVIASLAQWGVPEVLLSYVNRPEYPSRLLAGTTQVIAIGSGLLALVVVPLAYPFLAESAFRGVGMPFIVLAVASTAFSLSFQFSSRIIQLQGDLVAYNVLTVLRSAALLALTFIVLSPVGEPIQLAVYAYLGAEVMSALVSAGVLLRRAGWPWMVSPSLGLAVTRSGSSVQVGMVAAFLAAEIGVFIVNGMVDLEAVGWYTTGLGLARWTLFVSMATRVVLQTELAQFSGRANQIAETTALVCRHTLLWLIAAAVGLALGGHLGITLLYGDTFLPSYGPLLAALPGVAAHGITQLLSGYFISVERFGTPSVVAWFNLIVASALQVTLIPMLGITGASAGLSITYVLGALLISVLYVRHARTRLGVLIPGAAELIWYRQMTARAMAVRRSSSSI